MTPNNLRKRVWIFPDQLWYRPTSNPDPLNYNLCDPGTKWLLSNLFTTFCKGIAVILGNLFTSCGFTDSILNISLTVWIGWSLSYRRPVCYSHCWLCPSRSSSCEFSQSISHDRTYKLVLIILLFMLIIAACLYAYSCAQNKWVIIRAE